jgi:transposase
MSFYSALNELNVDIAPLIIAQKMIMDYERISEVITTIVKEMGKNAKIESIKQKKLLTDKWVTSKEATEIYDISEQAIRKACREGRLSYEKGTGKNKYLIKKEDIATVISTCAKVERDSIKFRLNDARKRKIELALSSGKTLADVGFGRPKGSVKTKERKEQEYAATIKALKRGLSLRDAAKISNVSVSTCQRIKKEFCL